MSDLIVSIQNHGFANDDEIFISWLNVNRFVSDRAADSFKLATTSGGSILEQFSTSIIDGFVRETSAAAATTTITGLGHLEAELVQFTVGGSFIGFFTVSSGAITVPSAVYTEYNVGMSYDSTVQPMKLDLEGTGLSVTKKLSRAVISLHNTIGGKIGPSISNLASIVYRRAGEAGEEFPYFIGDLEISLSGGYSRQGNIVIRQDEPLPITVLSLTLDIGVGTD